MTSKSQVPQISGPSEYDEELQAVDDYIEASGAQVPPVSELLSQINRLESSKLPDDELTSDVAATPVDNNRELEKLLEEERAESSKTPVNVGKLPAVPQVTDNDLDDAEEYEESFASQQETAQLREDFDTITQRFETLEAQFNLVMKERQNLPDVINNIRADLNTQLTSFSDKLYSILESQASKQEIKSALATIEEVRSEHSEQLKAASGYLSAEPKASSPIVAKGVSLKGRGKFKPVK